MKNLTLWTDYTREDVHAIFSPNTKFTPQAGTWGLQGIVRCPSNPGDWVFFVTFGQEQGDHAFDESITDEGVLSWQSQPAQRLNNPVIRELIHHDPLLNNVYLFLRVKTRAPYTYLGRLKYQIHDATREAPVHFQWQLLDWPAPAEILARIGLALLVVEETHSRGSSLEEPLRLIFSEPPVAKKRRFGVSQDEYRARKSPDYAEQDQRNRTLGLLGEELVLEIERLRLVAEGRDDLAQQVAHVSVIEGDTAGYDIRSYDSDGNIRYIEVKTTRGDAQTSFYISPGELIFSLRNSANYFLYRLYGFDMKSNSARVYVLRGDVSDHLDLTPVSFKANIKIIDDVTD